MWDSEDEVGEAFDFHRAIESSPASACVRGRVVVVVCVVSRRRVWTSAFRVLLLLLFVAFEISFDHRHHPPRLRGRKIGGCETEEAKKSNQNQSLVTSLHVQ